MRLLPIFARGEKEKGGSARNYMEQKNMERRKGGIH
jgi:hypothetical protein